jgi:hypothetical protein
MKPKIHINGYYDSPEDVARLLLLACDGNPFRAQIALRRAIKKGAYAGKKHGASASQLFLTSDEQLFLVARKIQLQLREKGKRCGDFTAIKKLAGRNWRTLWRKYQRRGQTLKQIALSYADYISDKTAPTF